MNNNNNITIIGIVKSKQDSDRKYKTFVLESDQSYMYNNNEYIKNIQLECIYYDNNGMHNIQIGDFLSVTGYLTFKSTDKRNSIMCTSILNLLGHLKKIKIQSDKENNSSPDTNENGYIKKNDKHLDDVPSIPMPF